MRPTSGTSLGLVAAALVAGLAGCSLPHVMPLTTAASTPGPSPYGPWYEQHWATNSVLLAAADQPEGGEVATDDWGTGETPADDATSPADDGTTGALDTSEPAVEASAEAAHPGEDFDDSSPYQFPASDFAPGASPSVEELTPPATKAPAAKPAPAPSGPIRY